jgi:hypothetical protein
MKLWSTSTEIDDARHMLVPQFAKMKHEHRLCLYRSTARAITVARRQLIIKADAVARSRRSGGASGLRLGAASGRPTCRRR